MNARKKLRVSENEFIANLLSKPLKEMSEIDKAIVSLWEESGYEHIAERAAAKLATLHTELEEEKARNELFSNCLHRGLQLWKAENPDSDIWISGDKNIKWLLDKVTAITARVTELEAERTQEVDEFNAGFDAYKADFDLDNTEQEYQSLMLAQNIPFHDVFGTGYAWAKFTTERAAVFAKGDAQ